MFTFLVFPADGRWRVQAQDDIHEVITADFAAAERRARWLATRAAVEGHESEVLLLDTGGAVVGRWWAESYTPLASGRQALAA